MSEKVKDIELDEFVDKVLASDEKVANQVREANIDAHAVIGKHKKTIDKYGVSTGIGFATARLREAVLIANSEVAKGLLVGQRDRFGTSAPIRIPVLSSTGEHMEVVNWGSSVKLGDSKVDLQFPCVASIRILYDGEFKGIPNIRLISAEKLDTISVPDAILRLGKVAKDAGELSGEDELKVTVVRGKIAYVEPATKWKGKEKDGTWQILLPNQKDTPVMHPVMQIKLETENGNSVRAIFERQRNAVPTVMVEDFMPLAEDAIKDSTEPGEQARFFGECMRGREVLIVGFVTKFTSQPEVNYIDMGAYAIFDAKVGKQATISKPKDESDDAEADAASEETEKPVQKTKGAQKTTKKTSGKAGSAAADDLKAKILEYCGLLGLSPKDLTPEKVIETVGKGKSAGFVTEILDELKAEA